MNNRFKQVFKRQHFFISNFSRTILLPHQSLQILSFVQSSIDLHHSNSFRILPSFLHRRKCFLLQDSFQFVHFPPTRFKPQIPWTFFNLNSLPIFLCQSCFFFLGLFCLLPLLVNTLHFFGFDLSKLFPFCFHLPLGLYLNHQSH